MILLTLFRAKQIAEEHSSASKVTPVIVVEEPESFLHPSAQAEFGRVLQDLADEFEVQLIVTTHSPYMLSHSRPESNILLERRVVRGQVRETVQVDTATSSWMEPFALALGIRDEEFLPWKELFFKDVNALLLVEGDIDAGYFNLLRDERHGPKALSFSGEIFAYGGKDTLKNQTLLRFIRDRYERVFVIFDLDAESDVEKVLKALGFEKGKTYTPIGVDEPGKRCMEGLVPETVNGVVHAARPDLISALSGTPEERRSAHSTLKGLYFEEFSRQAKPGDEYYGQLYKIAAVANRTLS